MKVFIFSKSLWDSIRGLSQFKCCRTPIGSLNLNKKGKNWLISSEFVTASVTAWAQTHRTTHLTNSCNIIFLVEPCFFFFIYFSFHAFIFKLHYFHKQFIYAWMYFIFEYRFKHKIETPAYLINPRCHWPGTVAYCQRILVCMKSMHVIMELFMCYWCHAWSLPKQSDRSCKNHT